MNFSKTYNPKKIEDKIYTLWSKSGFFNPDKLPGKRQKSYTISIPPPNITGSLHMGHALNATIQDLLIRFKRLRGLKTLWVPGTDHAGIATQVKVEKELKKEGKTRFDLGREKFLKRVWQWKEKYGNVILEQLKKLGTSCDWSRTRFTMDKEYCRAVEKAFLHYYKKGWIYQGKKVVNWCPRCQTSLSDLELEYKEKKGELWYIRYPLVNQQMKYITVATTRPETMLGDTAVAVNPKDKKYKDLIGKKVILPLANREILIIKDILIDPEFGTGAVKVTPAHDKTDYEISLKHNLKMIQVIDKKGEMTKNVPLSYQGLSVLDARKKIVKNLKGKGFLEKTEDYIYQVPKCYRCKTTIELIPSKQWFLKMQKLAKLAKKAVKNRKVEFIPKNFEKIYFNWLENIRDWCISRQIWWGHKIPLRGETDVLDTWFSSALWPFAILGWPAEGPAEGGRAVGGLESTKAAAGKPRQNKKSDLERFYPNNVLSTDRGIINLWVARMIFSGMELVKKVPFKKVYIHATVLTRKGERMSKSLGTGINPLSLIEEYGADATRFGIIYQNMGTQDIRFVKDDIVMGRKFCNKIWNATRFVLGQSESSQLQPFREALTSLDPADFNLQTKTKKLTSADKQILKDLNKTIKSIEGDLDNFRFGQAAHTLYDFFWHDFCDYYIEKFKSQKSKVKSQKVLLYVLLTSLKILHPFVPFITEEIYQRLPIKDKKKCLMVEDWPH